MRLLSRLRRRTPPGHWCPQCDGDDVLWQEQGDGGRVWWCADCAHEWGHPTARPLTRRPVARPAPQVSADPYA
ncbi:hypothetical protein OG596_38845 (plasmid) [Streptomyces sp. NBC_01102]|uniref:hypothetical protein n=1 Tax=Streptomyces sp. NBC_01102 TaxID=2903749 RepID=UPI00386B6039|nr:hypothetical protein OG596_38845 [Streptomyces sp. NBC_01102]